MTDNTPREISKPTETPVKDWIKFDKNDIQQSPRVVFSDIASPRPRQEEDPNDSFQLPLAVERARANAAARKRQIRFIMFGIAVLLVLLLGMAYFDPFDIEKNSPQIMPHFMLVIGLTVTLIMVVLLRFACTWMKTEEKYEKLDTVSLA